MRKPYTLTIVCCIAVLVGLFLLPACADYKPVRTDVIVLSSSEQEDVAWADLSTEGRCPLEDLRLRLSADPVDLWLSDRGNRAVVLSAAVLPHDQIQQIRIADSIGERTHESDELSVAVCRRDRESSLEHGGNRLRIGMIHPPGFHVKFRRL